MALWLSVIWLLSSFLATAPLRLQVDIHQEEITLHLIDSPAFPVVLGFPWLNHHNPHLDWITGTVLEWGPTCYATCLLLSPAPQAIQPLGVSKLSYIPAEYLDLKEVFSKIRASTLPPHWSYHCSIELLPRTCPPIGEFSLCPCPSRRPWTGTSMKHWILDPFSPPLLQQVPLWGRRMVDYDPASTTVV